MHVDELAAGFRFVWSHPLILGALSLDLFAVLLGGAVTLLPVYAEDILKVGPSGLGWLRTAPAIGALLMAILLAHRKPLAQAGTAMLLSVAGFGVATIVFGASRNFTLSVLMLLLTGALDNISVVIRHTLVQTKTPDHLRGRVSAVNSLFIGASNELGGFESGLVAHYFGPVVSVVSGGIGTILVVICTALAIPELRRYGKLGEEHE
jgi:MFS family permease